MSYAPHRYIVLVWIGKSWEIMVATDVLELATDAWEYYRTHGENFIRDIKPIFIDTQV